MMSFNILLVERKQMQIASILKCTMSSEKIECNKIFSIKYGVLHFIGLKYKNDELYNSVLSLMEHNIINCPLY